jgi:hypothetical protein
MATRILHILLAMVTLVSSTGVVLNKHFCQGEMKNAAVFVKPHSCHSGDAKPACPHHQQKDEDNGCCSNYADYLKLKQDQQTSSLDLQVPAPPQPVAVVVSVPAELLPSNTQLWPAYLSFKPPIVEPDIWLKLETILC